MHLGPDFDFINILIDFSEGPREDAFNFDLVPDYNTQTSVDLGQLGGRTFAKARYEGNKLITHIHNNFMFYVSQPICTTHFIHSSPNISTKKRGSP